MVIGMEDIHEAPRAVGKPEPGYFRMRVIRKGPWVPAAIFHIDGIWSACIDGETGSAHEDPGYADCVFRVWLGGRRISRSEYDHMLATKAWAAEHATYHPSVNVRKPLDVSKLPSIF